MENATVKLWAVRAAGDDSFSERGEIAFDWSEMGDLTALNPDRESFRAKFDAAYPDENAASRSAVSGALYRLVYEMQIGDYVACLHGDAVSLGTVSGPYEYRDGAHRRSVQWTRHAAQSGFSRDAMREITCSPVRLFPVKRFTAEFLSLLGVAYDEPERVTRPAAFRTSAPAPDESDASAVPTAAVRADAQTLRASDNASRAAGKASAVGNAETDAAKFVLDFLRRGLTREEFRQFVGGLLRAMGYAISASPDSGLSGFDMTARRDELSPPIWARVSAAALEDTEIDRLNAAIESGAYGLAITPYELSDRARESLKRAPSLRVVAGEELAALTLKYYRALDERYRAMIPLRMVYVPAAQTE